MPPHELCIGGLGAIPAAPHELPLVPALIGHVPSERSTDRSAVARVPGASRALIAAFKARQQG